ncbi:MAG: transglutaminase domain-containing protein [Clostridiales bacterium]|nr:transglutaminase domain-containing protein [Clostridiales bacterium]
MNVTKKNLLEILGAICVSALFAASGMHVAAQAWNVQLSTAKIYLLALAASVFVGGCVFGNDPVSRKAQKAAQEDGTKSASTGRAWGIFAALLGAAGIIVLSAGSVRDLLVAAKSAEVALSDYAPFIACVGTVGLTAAAFGVCRVRGGVYAMALAFFMILAASRSMGQSLNVLHVIPGLSALVAMYAVCSSDKGAALRTLVSSALIAAILATACLPGEGTVFTPLNNAANKARAIFEDYFKFTHSRVAYSLYMDGYQPLGELLGGPAQPSEDAVMRVESTEDLYLRGTIKNTYTGYSWTDNAVKSRYLYVDPMRAGVKAEVFGTENVNENAFFRTDAEVEFLAEGTSTLFVPYRAENVSAPIAMAVYFNTVGEVFLPRNAAQGDSYSFDVWLPVSESTVKAYSGADGAEGMDVALVALPVGVDARVYALAEEITQSAYSDYEKAAAIRDYLQNNYTYTLDGAYGSMDRDFVSDFLFDWKEGYCTYFASAMAVLSRAAGLPARYIEGYHVPADESGETIVTGLNAHAWTEVWIDGLGWMTFDATPGMDGEEPDSGENGTENSTEPTPTPTPPDEEQLPTPAPEQENDPGQHTPPTPTPDPGNQPPTPPENDNNDSDSDSDRNFAWLWWLLLALVILAGGAFLVRMRLAASDPVKLSAAQQDEETRLLVWYRALLTVFASEGQIPESTETPAMFARRMRAAGLATESFERFADALMLSRYAGKQASETQLEAAQQAYDELVSQLRNAEKIRWLRRRLVKGLGNIRKIP